jgi:hypothetical protein
MMGLGLKLSDIKHLTEKELLVEMRDPLTGICYYSVCTEPLDE